MGTIIADPGPMLNGSVAGLTAKVGHQRALARLEHPPERPDAADTGLPADIAVAASSRLYSVDSCRIRARDIVHTGRHR